MKGFALAALLAMPLFVFAQDGAAPTAETEEQKFVRLTRLIETQPLAEDAPTAFVIGWALATPKYSVLVCPMAGEAWMEDETLGMPLLLRAMAGNMAWQIEHWRDADELTKQHAGTLTALRVYENTVAKEPSRRVAYFDALLQKRDAGTLKDFLAPFVAEHCKDDGTGETLQVETDAEPPFLGGFLRTTDVVYPLQVGAWEWVAEHRYDDPGHGVSARYARKGDDKNWLDLYFYPVGTLDAAEAAKLAEIERNNLHAQWKEYMAAPDKDLGALSTFDIPLSQGALTGHVVDFVATRDGRRVHSAMTLGVHRLYAVKVRYSVDADKETREQARVLLQAFTRGLFARLEVDSTGGCWNPETPLAGCSAPKDELRAAPEGMRILRMEYSAPGAKQATPVVPLRAKRGGVG